MRKLLFLISAGVLLNYSCKTASENKNQSVQEKKDSTNVISPTTNESVGLKQDSATDKPSSGEVKAQGNRSSTKSLDTTKREKKIIHKHTSPDQQEIDSLKKAKGKKKFNKE